MGRNAVRILAVSTALIIVWPLAPPAQAAQSLPASAGQGTPSGGLDAGAAVPQAAPSAVAPPSGYPVHGIDVSSNNAPVDWVAAASDGDAFAFVKATEGTTYTNPFWSSDTKAAKAAGLLVGSYAFARPDANDPEAQANYLLSVTGLPAASGSLPSFVDLEFGSTVGQPDCWGLTPAQLVSWISRFVGEYQTQAGRPPLIYTNTSWWNSCTGGNGSFGASGLLIANWTGTPNPLPPGWGSFAFWQYTDDAVSSATSGQVDGMVFNGTLAALRSLAIGSHVGQNRPQGGGQNTFFLASANVDGGGAVSTVSFGNLGDVPLMGDWDGDGVQTVGVWRPSDSAFYLGLANVAGGGTVTRIAFGNSTDQPLAGKFGTDKTRDTVGVFRASTGTFYLASANVAGGGNVQVVKFASPGDSPIAGDWDGDGTTTVGIFRPSNGTFYLAGSNTTGGGSVSTVSFASPGDTPLAGDWNGDGITDVGVYRAPQGRFYLAGSRNVGGAPVTTFLFGNPTDKPFTHAP